ncbi:MAG TPA: class I SAM-dependent methyltransferase, partial [Chloroflexota bacterium]|nr:class I SAM-dependent methyltransferase [Chloroflexota bacterium]
MTPAQLRDTQVFFGRRAARWEECFSDDDPAFARAVAELRPARGGLVLDAGCGTGRAIPFLRTAVGPRGCVLALDVTPEMLAEVRRRGRDAALVLADGGCMPFRAGVFDAILAAGFVPHLEPAEAGLAELARITKRGGRLAIFHPIGRATL